MSHPHSPAPSATDTRPSRSDVPAGAGIFQRLSAEWKQLICLPSMALTLRRWARTEPALAGIGSLDQLLQRIDDGDRTVEDRYLLALVRLAQKGQQLAGRTVLQAMLPKLARMSAAVRSSSNDDRWTEDRRHIAVATFWEIVHSYPTGRRKTGVAANLALDTLHRLTSDLRRPPADIPVDPETIAGRLHQPAGDPGASDNHTGTISPHCDLLEVIAWGLDVQAITAEDASLLVRTYLPDGQDGGAAAIADAMGISHAALRQRCSRARRRLIAAVRADAAGLPVELQPA